MCVFSYLYSVKSEYKVQLNTGINSSFILFSIYISTIAYHCLTVCNGTLVVLFSSWLFQSLNIMLTQLETGTGTGLPTLNP